MRNKRDLLLLAIFSVFFVGILASLAQINLLSDRIDALQEIVTDQEQRLHSVESAIFLDVEEFPGDTTIHE